MLQVAVAVGAAHPLQLQTCQEYRRHATVFAGLPDKRMWWGLHQHAHPHLQAAKLNMQSSMSAYWRLRQLGLAWHITRCSWLRNQRAFNNNDAPCYLILAHPVPTAGKSSYQCNAVTYG